jgi:restriction system protein
MFPTHREMQIPVLRALVSLGGAPKAADVYPKVTAQFPELTDADLAAKTESGRSRWVSNIQWVRQQLVTAGYISSATHGVWAITDKGRQAVAEADGTFPEGASMVSLALSARTLTDLVQEHERALRAAVLEHLIEMSAADFEAFAGRLLEAYGFTAVVVTGGSGDGGIDGHGKLQVGLAMMDVAFQCKRWKGNVGGPQIDAFRGAISGTYHQGVMLTTAGYTAQAKEKSIQSGAVPIVLIDGAAIAELMIAKQLLVKRRPVYWYELDTD